MGIPRIWCTMVVTHKIKDLTFGVCRTNNGELPVGLFLDYYYSISWHVNDPRYRAHKALIDFKEGDASATARFLPLITRITNAAFLSGLATARPTHIAPVLSSTSSIVTPGSREWSFASNISSQTGLAPALDFFTQKPRQALHRFHSSYAQRKAMVSESLRCGEVARKTKVLLIDDVFTYGSTIEAYASAIASQGGLLVGAVVVMKFTKNQKLLNPALFATWGEGKVKPWPQA